MSNDLDFIQETDPEEQSCTTYKGRFRAEMPDKRHETLLVDNVDVLQIAFNDETSLAVWVHPDFGGWKRAQGTLVALESALAKLPLFMRSRLDHVVLHSGNETAFAEDAGRFFVLYSENIDERISTHDLEETVFHEAVHASMDIPVASSTEWQDAQKADGTYVSDYAKEHPVREDLAETAIFAWTLLKHPGRLPQDLEIGLKRLIPNRLRVLNSVFADYQRSHHTKKSFDFPSCQSEELILPP
ncbi:hypothetical protein [Rhizobium sp. PP-F2F-G48]|uniref:hypothetical protein n=1 Tax=Rhizobium sp. PP-F2F-G48 TaxID=2135651 RepID=UPI001048EF3E|nr:hypothetical protein [Rhizobium sp. PP-F2F-G48]